MATSFFSSMQNPPREANSMAARGRRRQLQGLRVGLVRKTLHKRAMVPFAPRKAALQRLLLSLTACRK